MGEDCDGGINMFDGDLTLDQIMSIPAPGPGEAGNAPQWSPDGSRILFVSSLGGSPDIWSISPQGGFPSRVSLGLGTADYAASHMPLWSPDGRHVSYISNKSSTNEVWLWHTSGDPESQLTNLGANIQSMCWAPDGKSLVLSGNRYGGYDIYRIDLPSGDAELDVWAQAPGSGREIVADNSAVGNVVLRRVE